MGGCANEVTVCGDRTSPTRASSATCPSYPPSNCCVPISWPGYATTAWHEGVGTIPATGYEHYWFGSLAVGMRDASGQMYMRNRYYDPQTGQLTQTDPIGLAGGLNAYGFAAGGERSWCDLQAGTNRQSSIHEQPTRYRASRGRSTPMNQCQAFVGKWCRNVFEDSHNCRTGRCAGSAMRPMPIPPAALRAQR